MIANQQPTNRLATKEEAEATLLQMKSWTAVEAPISEEVAELLIENSLQLLDYCINKDSNLPGDEVSFAELLLSLRSAFGRVGRDDNQNVAQLLLNGVQKDDLFRKLVASFKSVLYSGNASPSSAIILLRLAQIFSNILTLHYKYLTASNVAYFESSSLQLLDVDTLSFIFSLPKTCSDRTTVNMLHAFTAFLHVNFLKSERMREILSAPQMSHIWESQLILCQKNESEFSTLLFFGALKEAHFFRSIYQFTSTTANRIILLDIVQESMGLENTSLAALKSGDCLQSPEEYLKVKSNSERVLADDGVLFLVEAFQGEIESLLSVPNSGNVDTNFDEEKIYLLCQQSALLLSLSSRTHYSELIRRQQHLLEALVRLLKSLQLWSRSNPDSVFACRGQLKDVKDLNAESSANPAYGFKRNIIGLIANIICRNRAAQDYLRTSDGLAALLDCTKIDARNPFILQWSIFAIHNALEGNSDNQQYVEQMRKQGILHDDDLLEKLQHNQQPK